MGFRQVTVLLATASAVALTASAGADGNAPVNNAVPTIAGAATVGATLTADPGQWDGDPTITFAYQWLSCDESGQSCTDIVGATDIAHDVTPDDIGFTIAVEVTASNDAGSDLADSAPTTLVPAPSQPPVNTARPVVTGTAQVGVTLSADPGAWTGDQPITFDYQWRDCDNTTLNCSDVAGATGSTYGVVSSDIGWSLVVRVTASNTADIAVATSVPTAVVVAGGFRLTPTSPASCPSTQVVVPNRSDYKSTAANTTFVATGTAWNQRPAVGDYSIQLKYSGRGNCWIGGSVQGTNSPTLTWTQLKNCCNGAGLNPAHGLSIFGVRLDNIAVDDFRLVNADGNDSYYISGSHLTATRDDCFSTAHAAVTVNDTLAECYTVISWRNTGRSGTAFPVTFTNDLLYLQPQLSGNESRCKTQLAGAYGNGQIWKEDSFKGTPALIHVTNTIFRADLGNDMTCTLTWPNGTFANDTVVWTGPGPYPGTLPAGVRLTTDVTVWNDAVSAWLAAHPGM